MNVYEDYLRLVAEAERLPSGPTEVAVLEEAVRLADTSGDLDLQFAARQQLIAAAFRGGEGKRLMVALAWCLGVFDRHQTDATREFQTDYLLWQCKHGISYAPSFCEISCEEMVRLRHDVVRRYQAHGASCRSVYMLAACGEHAMGHTDKAIRLRKLALEAAYDWFAEPPEWEQYFELRYLERMQEHEELTRRLLLALAEPNDLDDTYPWLVSMALPLFLKSGRLREAALHHHVAYRKIAGNPKHCSHVGDHIVFCAATGNLNTAVRLFEKHLPVALSRPVPASRLGFLASACFLLDRLVDSHREQVAIQLPSALQDCERNGSASVRALRDCLQSDVDELAGKFNARNGTEATTDWIAEINELVEFATEYPL